MKKITRLLALVMAVLLLSGWALTASASSNLFGMSNSSNIEELGENCVTNFSASDNPGIFALRFTKGMETGFMAAFLVKYGEYSYLMTHEMAGVLANDDFEMTLLGPNGSEFPAIFVTADDEYDIAYLYAEGVEVFNPLRLEADAFAGTIVGGIPFCDDDVNKFMRVEYRAFDFAKWNRVKTNLYTIPDKEYSDNWLGCPVFQSSTEYIAYGMGTWYESGGNHLAAVVNFRGLELNTGMSLELLPAYLAALLEEMPGEETTTPTTEKPDDPKPSSGTKWILIGLAIIGGVGFWLYSGKKKEQEELRRKQMEAQAAQAAMPDYTIPVSETAPVYTHGVTKAVSNWQLRCTGGPLNGKTFPISGSVKMGRSSKSDISFPDSTAGVSGNHCELMVSGDSVSIWDVGSTYGTYVNGNRIVPNVKQTLYAGDSFTLAQNGPAFRLERVGGAGGNGGQPGGPAVKDLQGKTYQSKSSGRLTFGRADGNTVILSTPNKEISGNHCVLYREGGQLYLKDLGSTNGTFFTEKDRLKPNTPYRIRKGQAFFLSSAKYTFVVTEE